MICRCLSNKHLTCYGEASGQRGITETQEHWTALTNFPRPISPPVQTLHFQDWRISDLPKSGAAENVGQSLILAQVPQEAGGILGGRGSPPAPSPGWTSSFSGTVQGLCALPGEEVANLAQRLPVPAHSKVTKICLWECLPSFSRVFSAEIMF